ncbi:DNA alkylation repair protein [Agrococcus lahaulensis]|uniref:DNA alkylation repair protein n=1 Tax=Agrococcus lahaulensis TaxID=341722 RepID=UPI0006868E2E|nr:DNA alkylation repair protein [Agrococcus lahaulensis]
MVAPEELVAHLRGLATPAQRAPLERALADRTETEILGVRMGAVFALAREHLDASLDDVRVLLRRPEHEARVLALSILGQGAKRAKHGDPWLAEAAALYVAEHDRIVSWDLVDLAAPSVLGRAAVEAGTAMLDGLAASGDPLRQRSALMGSLALVRRGRATDAVRLAVGMLGSSATQLQRTIGAVLREVGKVDRELLTGVLEREAPRMTAIALRFATERLEPAERERLRALRTR